MVGGKAWRVGVGCVAACLLMASGASAAITIHVTRPDDPDNGMGSCGTAGGSCSLREAVNFAQDGDTVSLPAGTYKLSQSAGVLAIVHNITLAGAGPRTTTIKQTLTGQNVIGTGFDRTITITGVTITGGNVGSPSRPGGGGIQNSATLTLKNSAVTGNTAAGYLAPNPVDPMGPPMMFPGVGGGIYNGAGSLTIVRSTVSGNTVNFGAGDGAQGGGIFSNVPVTVINSTIAGNSAAGLGGGIDAAGNTAGLTLSNATIAFNSTAGPGGNLYLDPSASSTVKNTVIGGGMASTGQNCGGGTLTSQGYNLEDRNECGLSGTGDQVSKPAKLGQLHNNGGPTDTVALLSGSPAINSGNPLGCKAPSNITIATDERGVHRPQGIRCDIGAFEFRLPTLKGSPKVSGKPKVGDKLICLLPAVQSQDGPVTKTVTWLRGGTRIASGKTYTVRSSDAGKRLSCRVTARNSAGSVSATSAAVSATR